ncbi:MAG: alkaline phosphatase [Candidatus Bathyarchaeota archaeon]|nr:alkaline phosphatase [Candidatus Bathyarchaeota archaeon]
MENKYRILVATIFVAVIAVSMIAVPAFSANAGFGANNRTKNVIVMIPDGCSQSIETLTRWYNGGGLYLDTIVTGTVATYMSDSVITDSASAGTAFATGHKTTDGFISVGPRTEDLLTGFIPTADPYEPLATVLEGAQLEGKATGLIATSRITHATPAVYAAHINDRNNENEIMEQLVYHDVDVVLGGGFRHLINSTDSYTTSFGETWNGKRTDSDNLYQTILDRGYQFVDNKDDLLSVDSGKLFGMFAESHMEADIDRADFAAYQPSIAEMTKKAIDLLSQDKDGFFLMVEGSQVDWAGHANDPIHMVTDFLAFDEAVGVALEFAAQDKQTLVLAFPDHNTGGLTIGSYYQDSNAIGHGYTDLTVEDIVNPLLGMEITSTGLVRELAGVTGDNDAVRAVFEDRWNISVTDDDIAAMDLTDSYSISEYISQAYTPFGWTTHGHTGDDVPLWAYSPSILTTPIGHYDNTALAEICADALGFRLDQTTNQLYVNVASIFSEDQWNLNFTDPQNPVLEITTNNCYAELPVSKDSLTITSNNGHVRTFELEGVVVYAPMNGDVYLPFQAAHLIR